MVPPIPPELVDQILEELHTPIEERVEVWQGHPKGSLTACSLVCHTWNAIARPHLFRDILYTFVSEVRAGLEPWEDIPEAQADFGRWCMFPSEHHTIDPRVMEPTKTLSMFCDFLLERPHYASCVRTLTLRGSPHDWTPAWGASRLKFSYGVDFYDDPEVFATILSQLPRLSHLKLVDVFLCPPPVLFPPTHFPFGALRHVSLSYLTAQQDQASELVGFIGSLFDVDEFHVIHAGFTRPSSFPVHSFALGTVILTNVSTRNEELLPQLLSFNPHTLVLDHPPYRGFADYSRHLRYKGSLLRKLIVQVSALEVPSFVDSMPPLDLSYCDSLESLSYTLEPYHHTRAAALASVGCLAGMLSTLLWSGKKSLREVTLRIRMDEGGVFPNDTSEAVATAELDTLLVDLATMRREFWVRIKCEGDAKLTQERRDTYLKRSFPRLISSRFWAHARDVDVWEKDLIHRSYLPFKL